MDHATILVVEVFHFLLNTLHKLILYYYCYLMDLQIHSMVFRIHHNINHILHYISNDLEFQVN